MLICPKNRFVCILCAQFFKNVCTRAQKSVHTLSDSCTPCTKTYFLSKSKKAGFSLPYPCFQGTGIENRQFLSCNLVLFCVFSEIQYFSQVLCSRYITLFDLMTINIQSSGNLTVTKALAHRVILA